MLLSAPGLFRITKTAIGPLKIHHFVRTGPKQGLCLRVFSECNPLDGFSLLVSRDKG